MIGLHRKFEERSFATIEEQQAALETDIAGREAEILVATEESTRIARLEAQGDFRFSPQKNAPVPGLHLK